MRLAQIGVIFITFLGLAKATPTFSYEVKDVCATYAGTKDVYLVEAKIMDGRELNKRAKGYSYNSYAKYMIIFWDNAAARIIEMENSYCNLSYSDCEGKDQQGYIWEMTENRYRSCH